MRYQDRCWRAVKPPFWPEQEAGKTTSFSIASQNELQSKRSKSVAACGLKCLKKRHLRPLSQELPGCVCSLPALVHEVIPEERDLMFILLEGMRREHGGQDGHASIETDTHHGVQNGPGDEIVTVDAAIDDERRPNDRGISVGPDQRLCMQWDFERAGHIDDLDFLAVASELLPLVDERFDASVNDVRMPSGTDNGDLLSFRIESDGHGRLHNVCRTEVIS